MVFKFKVFTTDQKTGQPDPSKFTMDEMAAEREDDVYKAFNLLGQKIEITERVGTSDSGYANKPLAPGEIPGPPSITPFRGGGITPTVKPPPPAVIEFEDNGIKFKVDNGTVFKKDWTDVDMAEYRIVDSVLDEKSPKIQKLDWVKVK